MGTRHRACRQAPWLMASVAVLAALGLAAAVPAAAAPVTGRSHLARAAARFSVTYAFTRGEQLFVVPPGVTRLSVTLTGAAGGAGTSGDGGAAGGEGEQVAG